MKSVLITGTSKGIGFETALAFARAGYRVHATMRNPERSPELAAVAARESLPIHVTAMDVDSDQSVRTAIAAIQTQHGTPDVLVNNAGVECFGSVEETPLAEFRVVMETNYFGVIRCLQALLPKFRERRTGTIINISSVAGRFCSPPSTPYAASKWALEALCEGLAAEMKMFGVRVAVVEPGIINTSMAQRISQGGNSVYPHSARISKTFTAVLTNAPVPPNLVATKVLEVARSDSWQFRYLVGPDAASLLAWRGGLTDEQWIDLHASDDATFEQRMTAR